MSQQKMKHHLSTEQDGLASKASVISEIEKIQPIHVHNKDDRKHIRIINRKTPSPDILNTDNN
jgi:hypothetical protein